MTSTIKASKDAKRKVAQGKRNLDKAKEIARTTEKFAEAHKAERKRKYATDAKDEARRAKRQG